MTHASALLHCVLLTDTDTDTDTDTASGSTLPLRKLLSLQMLPQICNKIQLLLRNQTPGPWA
jgi:hypothetical protein